MWLSLLLPTQSPNRGSKARAVRRPTARFRPRLEALEDRCVPSTLTVTNAADSGPGSLRYEISQANTGDTIVFGFSKKLSLPTITLTSGELESPRA
jgi:hypothetical protein